MKQKLDLRGIPCPEPLLHIKKALQVAGLTDLELVIDNASTAENVTDYLKCKKFSVTVVKEQSLFIVQGTRALPSVWGALLDRLSFIFSSMFADKSSCGIPRGAASDKRTFVLITADRLGSGDDELGKKLMANYIKTLEEMGNSLWQLVFVNGGVRLATTDSAVLSELQGYERRGVQILVCGTCLEYFKLAEEKQVGQTTNMLDIISGMDVADKVITL